MNAIGNLLPSISTYHAFYLTYRGGGVVLSFSSDSWSTSLVTQCLSWREWCSLGSAVLGTSKAIQQSSGISRNTPWVTQRGDASNSGLVHAKY